MALLPEIPSIVQPTHTVSTKVLIAGKDVIQGTGGLLSLSVHQEINRIPSATLVLVDGTVEKGTFAKSGSPQFAPGQKLDVQLGYQNQTKSVFKGLIVKHSVKASSSRPSVLGLECKDVAVHLTLVRKSRYFIEMKDKDVFREILNSHAGEGISIGDLADTDVKHSELVQYHCTDWDFLVMRAEANGLVVKVTDGKISIVKPEKAMKADFDLRWGTDIIDIEAEIDARTHHADIAASTWDAVNGKMATEKGSGNVGGLGAGLGGGLDAIASVGSALGIDLGTEDDKRHFPDVFYQNHTPQLFHGGDMPTEALSSWAKAQQKRAELSQVRGRVQVRGQYYAPLHTLALRKLAARFNGTHLVTGVLHQIHSGTWETDLQFGLSPQTFAETHAEIAMPDAAGLLPAIQGLHIGIVTKLEGDTVGGGYRVRVKLPFIAEQSGQKDGIWARMATLSAGKERGTVFRPELKDEVILGFINNDPNDAVILGALHSKPHAAPIEAKDGNPQQGYFAKKGMTLIFDDDKKSIELKTKEGFMVLLSESEGKIALVDKNKNSITLSSSGVSLVSKTNISIEAVGEVSIKGKFIHLNKPTP